MRFNELERDQSSRLREDLRKFYREINQWSGALDFSAGQILKAAESLKPELLDCYRKEVAACYVFSREEAQQKFGAKLELLEKRGFLLFWQKNWVF